MLWKLFGRNYENSPRLNIYDEKKKTFDRRLFTNFRSFQHFESEGGKEKLLWNMKKFQEKKKILNENIVNLTKYQIFVLKNLFIIFLRLFCAEKFFFSLHLFAHCHWRVISSASSSLDSVFSESFWNSNMKRQKKKNVKKNSFVHKKDFFFLSPFQHLHLFFVWRETFF